MAKMAGKVALVIGGATGIGAATAERIAAEGALVYLTGRNEDAISRTASAIGRNARALQADAANVVDIEKAVATIVAERSRIDVLVFNAGKSEAADLLSTTADLFDRQFALNVRAPVLAVRSVVPHMPPGSAIVLVGSCAGGMAYPHLGTYAVSKAAIRSYARTWTVELAPRGIRVNVLSPGPTFTPAMEAASDAKRALLLDRTPMGRFARADEIAAAALFLASDDSSFMAGSEMQVDGGMAQV